MMWVCVPVVINMHSHTCAFIAVVLKIDRCTCTYILWKYSKGIRPIYKRREESAKLERRSLEN
jgi:hypothetical protein